jgi:uncharacterized cupin superfamily protein
MRTGTTNMSERYTTVDFENEEQTDSDKSDLLRVEIADVLGCEHMGARAWYLQPGESIAYHKQREQEELYIPFERDGQMRIDGEVIDVPRGTAVHVPPETPRQMINEGDREHVWLAISAPHREDDGILVDPL